MSARPDPQGMSHDQLIAELVADYNKNELAKEIAHQISGNPRLALLLFQDRVLRYMLANLREDRAAGKSKKIITSHVCPPIPIRSHDWCAHFDGEEELGNYGYGHTEQEAIDDLLANQDDEQS